MRLSAPWFACVTALALLLPDPATGQERPYERSFVATIGVDTVQVDRLRWGRSRIEGGIVLRVGRTGHNRFVVELSPDGSITRFESSVGPAADPEASPSGRLVAEYGADTIRGTFTFRGQTRDFSLPSKGDPIPFASLYGTLHYEMALDRVLASGKREMELTGLHNGGLTTVHATVLEPGRLVRFDIGGGFGHVLVEADGDGRARRIDATGTTIKMLYERVEPLGLDTLAGEYVRRDRAGQGLGTLSPGAETRATVHGADITVEYGRPRKRGREVFGAVVPWGEVWRTGANAATMLTTSRDLEMAGTVIPAGSYTLWTIPGPVRWTLVINGQTGQWGTRYDPSRDVARLPMATARLPETIRSFTIRVEETGEGGILRLQWDRTEARMPFRVR